MNGKRLPLKRLRLPGDAPELAGPGEAQVWRYLVRVLVNREAPEVSEQLGVALAAFALTVMQENLQLKLGVTPEQARGTAVGWIIGRAAGSAGEGDS